MNELNVFGIQNNEKLKGSKISPFQTHCQDVANTFYMLHRAVELLQDTWTQSPHWDRTPTNEMLEYEQRLEDQAVEAAEEVERLAGEIFLSLTGKTLSEWAKGQTTS